jgi:hypothetical protein
MFRRQAQERAATALRRSPAVVLVGPRQVGKTTLARQLMAEHPGALLIDLESEAGRQRMSDPERALPALRDRLVVLDELQQMPELFRSLRPEIDADRRPGRFLLLGSASGDLVRQSSESLAGRVTRVELTPLTVHDLAIGTDAAALQKLWWRGGYPLSWGAVDDEASLAWRQQYIETLIHRDLPAMGVRIATSALRRFWAMLAHLQGQLFNASQLGQALGGLSHATVGRYLDLMEDALVVRRLPPCFANVGKRLVKSPKVYVRDSGLAHTLMGAADPLALQVLPQAGGTWEGFVIEQIADLLPPLVEMGFYRTAAGAELDLVLERGMRRVGVEIKLSAAPRPARGFWQALADLEIREAFVVAPVEEAYPIAQGVTVVPVAEVGRIVDALGAPA